MAQKIALIGASGFVGGRLLQRFKEVEGFEIVCMGRSPVPGFAHAFLDLKSPDTIAPAFAQVRPSFVFQLAAQSSVVGANSDKMDSWKVNAEANAAIASAMSTYVPECGILYTSSSEVYGEAFNSGEVNEDTCPKPLSTYACSKLAGELAYRALLTPQNQLIVVRPSNHSGLGQSTNFVLPSFASQVANETQVRVGNIEVKRDFLHVEDVVSAYMHIFAARANIGQRECYNVSSGSAVSLSEVLASLVEMAGGNVSVEVDPKRYRATDVEETKICAQRLAKAVGWKPKHSLEFLLKELISGHSLRKGGE